MVRRPVGVITALCAALLVVAACSGGSSKSAASSDSTSSSKAKSSSSSSASSDAGGGGGTSADVTDKGSFCKAAKDISDANNEVTGAVLTILGDEQSSGGGSFPSDAEKAVQALGPRLSKDYDAMAKASTGSVHDDVVTLRDFSAGLFQPIVDASSRDEFSSAIDALTSAGRSSEAQAAAKATTNLDAVTSSECNVHIAANQ